MTGGRPCLVITSIAQPTAGLAALAAAARESGFDFVLVGDEPSPPDFELEGCEFYSVEHQRALGYAYAELAPLRRYARKNIGYLAAVERGASVIVETDDDTVAYDRFWTGRERRPFVGEVAGAGWVNVYRYFSRAHIWPRGLPLDEARAEAPDYRSLDLREVDCPIQQGLVDNDPDVDAVYRMLLDLPFSFDPGPSVALTAGTWCPFNSQNTTWWPDAYPLLYLPASCSFRMTDIWRSFVAQRIAWANGWGVLFHEPTVLQMRNEHDLMRDFGDEVPGYVDNRAICAALEALEVLPGRGHLADNLRRAYELLVDRGWLEPMELGLLDAWLADIGALSAGGSRSEVAGTPRLL